MTDLTLLTGILAGFLTTISFLPQVVHTFKTKSTRDISLGMFSTFCLGVFLWLVYGVMIDSLPVILANSVTLVFALMILAMKLKYK